MKFAVLAIAIGSGIFSLNQLRKIIFTKGEKSWIIMGLGAKNLMFSIPICLLFTFLCFLP
jgi:hypothetical protein